MQILFFFNYGEKKGIDSYLLWVIFSSHSILWKWTIIAFHKAKLKNENFPSSLFQWIIPYKVITLPFFFHHFFYFLSYCIFLQKQNNFFQWGTKEKYTMMNHEINLIVMMRNFILSKLIYNIYIGGLRFMLMMKRKEKIFSIPQWVTTPLS